MSEPQEFIKKGVIENETEDQPVKTASDEIVEQVKSCSAGCRCTCNTKKDEVKNEDN